MAEDGAQELELAFQQPEYGINYDKGYIGFTYTKKSIISTGIAYFTRWSRMRDIKVSHALIVTGENECVEALVGDGVVWTNLKKYFNNKDCQIFFRKPKGLLKEHADRIAAVAAQEVGNQYDLALIPAQAGQGSFVGKLLNRVFNNRPDRMISRLLNRDDRWICSELAAHCLESVAEFKNRGILNDPQETIDPQELFEDDDIFAPWKTTTAVQGDNQRNQ